MKNNEGIKSYEDLEVWRQAFELAVECYAATGGLPKHEVFGLASQIRRAAVSVPANVAEGQARRSTREFIRYLLIARGSLAELETHVRIGRRLSYFDEPRTARLIEMACSVGRLLNGLLRSLDDAQRS